jgi:Zn-dependent protease
MAEIILIAFSVAIFLYSVIIHEVSHGYMALKLGDLTAKYAGRLNLNPFKHIDPIGSILVPFMMIMTAGFAFGWAKPVPYNPYNLKNQKWGPALVALAGPLSNLAIALAAALVGSLVVLSKEAKIDIVQNFDNFSSISQAIAGSLGSIFFELMVIIIFWNTLLAFFNLIPVPPLDGSKILFSIIPIRIETMAVLEQFGFFLLIILIIVDATTFNILGHLLAYLRIIFFRLAIS